jgi:phosphoribosylanthranilate isomerase
MVRVKICGITNAADARFACDLGADALGFNFYKKSPRSIDLPSAKKIVRGLPPFVRSVGVFVTGKPTEMVRIAQSANLGVIQLHGDQCAAHTSFCATYFPVIRAFRVGAGFRLSELDGYKAASAILLDAASSQAGQFGGTGKTMDWGVAREAAKSRLIILAGGLTPENVAAAILLVRPYAVDVASGVESKPGKKDRGKLRDFMQEVRRAESQLQAPAEESKRV